MKQYLKMADGFDFDEAAIEQRLFGGCISKEEAAYAAHAVVSHDELVQMNQGLLAKLAEIVGCFEAALVDGWIDAVADEDVSLINDIYCRRIDYARHIAISALTGGSV